MKRKGKGSAAEQKDTGARQRDNQEYNAKGDKASPIQIGPVFILLGIVVVGALTAVGVIVGNYISNSAIGNKKIAHDAMWEALDEEDVAQVKAYLRLGADPNHREGKDGNVPLLQFAHFGNVEGVKMLLEHGADPRLANHGGTTALHVAAWCSPAKSTDSDEVLQDKLKTACEPIIKLLLDAGADTDPILRTNHNIRPLHWIVERGGLQGARYLLEKGADPNAPLDEGTTPIHIAKDLLKGDVRDKMVKLLVKFGADESTPAPTPS